MYIVRRSKKFFEFKFGHFSPFYYILHYPPFRSGRQEQWRIEKATKKLKYSRNDKNIGEIYDVISCDIPSHVISDLD